MMGSGGALDQDVFPEDYGLIPRICSGLFDRVEQVRYAVKSPFGLTRAYVVEEKTASAQLARVLQVGLYRSLEPRSQATRPSCHFLGFDGFDISLSGTRADDKI